MSNDPLASGRRAAVVAIFTAFQDEMQRQGKALPNGELPVLTAVAAAMALELAMRANPDLDHLLRFINRHVANQYLALKGAQVMTPEDARLAVMAPAGRA